MELDYTGQCPVDTHNQATTIDIESFYQKLINFLEISELDQIFSSIFFSCGSGFENLKEKFTALLDDFSVRTFY